MREKNVSAQILDGSATAAAIREDLAAQVKELTAGGKRAPGLAVVLVGDDPASHIYVKNKVNACKKTGIQSWLFQFPADATPSAVLSKLHELNEDNSVDGILVPGGFGMRGIEGKIQAIQFARECEIPFFGICLGMQLLSASGTEGGDTEGLGLIPGQVQRMVKVEDRERIPHVGWKEVLAADGNAHLKNGTHQHVVGGLASRAVGRGDLDGEVIDHGMDVGTGRGWRGLNSHTH